MNGVADKPVSRPGAAVRPVSSAGTAAFLLPKPFLVAVSALLIGFALPLFDLMRYSLSESFYSHILLVPLISLYLVWSDRRILAPHFRASFVPGALCFLMASLLLAGFFTNRAELSRNDALTWTILPFCLYLTSAVFFFLGSEFARKISLPLGFFFFVTPFPEAVTHFLEIASQVATAEVYSWMLTLVGTPFFREGQEFRIPALSAGLPGLSLVIAQECSGIRSSFVLLLTSLLAGYMFLKSPWRRAFLAFFVIPLGIVRNGFRVLALSLLTVHVDPRFIDSALHHRGGPIFFALSLIPFFLVLWWLRRNENKRPAGNSLRDG